MVPPNKERMDVYLKRDIKDLRIVADFFVNSDYSYIYIDKISFKDKVKVLRRLFYLKGYKAIGFNDNTVYFLKWSFGENDRGIAISVDGEIEPTVDYLIELIPLSETGWYYYEADYEKFYNSNAAKTWISPPAVLMYFSRYPRKNPPPRLFFG